MTSPASRNTQRGEQQQKDQSLLWSCIARNDIILTEAGEDRYQGAVTRAAVQLLAKKSTPGWEYSTCSAGTNHKKLKGVKFHIYDHTEDVYSMDPMVQRTIWVYACVYDPTLVELHEVQSFLEKMVVISEHYRDDLESDWKYGAKGVAQDSFGPILQQRMQEITYLGKMAMLQTQMDHATSIMARNIELLLARGDQLEVLHQQSTTLKEMVAVFKTKSKKVQRQMLWHNAKHGLVLGTAITVGVGIVVVPPMLALL
jgi:hypothetical protein